MAGSEVIGKLQSAELSFPVEKWRYKGMDLWPILRTNLAFAMDPNAPSYTRRSLLAAGFEALRLCLSHIIFDFKNWRKIPWRGKSDFVFLGATYETFLRLDEQIFNFQSDPIVQLAQSQNQTAALLDYSFLARAPAGARKSPGFSVTLLLILGGGLGVLGQIIPGSSFRRLQKEIFDQLSAAQLVPDATLNKILSRVPVIYQWSRLFAWILKWQGAKAAFVTSYYGPVGSAYTTAARRIGLSLVDVQHGHMGETHPGYASFKKFPVGGWNTLPSYFWVWGKPDADGFSTWHADQLQFHQVVELGDPQAIAFADPQSHVLANAQAQFPQLIALAAEAELRIMITLQLSPDIDEKFLDLFHKAPKQWRWFVRAHPSMRTRIDHFERQLEAFPNVEIRESSFAPLYLVLTQCCDIHLTEFSSTVAQAANLGVPSLLLHPVAKEHYAEYVERGLAFESLETASTLKLIAEKSIKQSRGAGNASMPSAIERARDFLRPLSDS